METQGMNDKLGLYRKIAAVMKEVTYLQKDDKVEFQTTKYKAISEEKVTMAVRSAMVTHGLVILPIEQEHFREGNLSTVNTKYKIVDTETGAYEIIVSSGTGSDTQDKGVGKAMTYSFKYLLLRTFAIPTGEDPDKISSAELDAKEQREQEKEAEPLKIPAALKAKYKILTGSDDGLEAWVQQQHGKGRNVQTMQHILQEGINKKQHKEAEQGEQDMPGGKVNR